MSSCARRRADGGQAVVELLAVLPLACLAVVAAWQLALAGQAMWLTGAAARSAARAALVGADPARAARAVLPPRLARAAQVTRAADGSVAVAVHVPLLPGGEGLTVARRARLEASSP